MRFNIMKIKVAVSVILLGILSCCFTSGYAWNAMGHMVISQIAYINLKPEVKKKVDIMVSDLNKEYPEINSFYQLGPWADSIRSQKIDIYSHWHYTDIAFSTDGTPLKNLEDSDNVTWAIEKMKPVVANDKANPFERARFLALLVHTIGDIHQPLHTASRISAKYPDGDRGGNLYYVKFPASKPQSMTLHRLWDQGIDVFSNDSSYSKMSALANHINAQYPMSYFESRNMAITTVAWAEEGFNSATTVVYNTPENQVPSQQYIDSGRQLAQQKAALAGYRLAAVLNELLG